MSKAFVINGSPRTDKGNTARLLTPFVQGMVDGGAEVELVYASRLNVKPCTCGIMQCWNKTPEVCCIRDEMDDLFPRLKAADTLVLATPVYIPLPGAMQNVVNRLVPLMDPVEVWRGGRTRAKFHADVGIRRIALVATGGWWEKGNLDTVVRIAEELAKDAGVDFAGAVLRPHASYMRSDGALTPTGQKVLEAAHRAGRELAATGTMTKGTLRAVSRPLVSREEYWRDVKTDPAPRAAKSTQGA